MNDIKRIKGTVLILFLTFVLFFCACSYTNEQKAGNFLLNIVKNPSVSATGGEWTVIALSKSGNLSKEYKSIYLSNLENKLQQKKGVLSEKKSTEYSRVVLALCEIGQNPYDFCGFDIISPLYDFDFTTNQGINGAIYALMALNASKDTNYEYHKELIRYIVSFQNSDGGFGLSKVSLPDITACAVVALSPYGDDNTVKKVLADAIMALDNMQDSDGCYDLYGTKSSESISQAIMAYCAVGQKDKAQSLKEKLNEFYKNGGYCHTVDAEPSVFSTEQALIALYTE